MDPLEEQLAQLSLMNSHGLASRTATFPGSSPLYHQDEIQKNHGPMVPPKPEKKAINNYFTESLYASTGNGGEMRSTPPPPLISRQSTDIYHKTTKETLDNPQVLEQKLEALAYHKQQLDRLKKKNSNQQVNYDNIPKLSSSSLVYKQGVRPKMQEQQPLQQPQQAVSSHPIYSNYQVTKSRTPTPQMHAHQPSSASPMALMANTPTPTGTGKVASPTSLPIQPIPVIGTAKAVGSIASPSPGPSAQKSSSPLPIPIPCKNGHVAQTANIYGNIIQNKAVGKVPELMAMNMGNAPSLSSPTASSSRPIPKPLNMNNYKIYCNIPYDDKFAGTTATATAAPSTKYEMNATSSLIPNSIPLTTQILTREAGGGVHASGARLEAAAAMATAADLDDFGRDSDELPPPSPVSSSYSELRRATNVFQNNPTLQAKGAGGVPAAAGVASGAGVGGPTSAAALLNNGTMPLNKSSLASANNLNNIHYITNKLNAHPHGHPLSHSNPNAASLLHHQTYGDVYLDNSSSTHEFSNYSLNTELGGASVGGGGSSSSAYESIYEPINPRPPSQLSARFNYLNYSPYENAAVIAENNTALLNHSNFSSLSRTHPYPDSHNHAHHGHNHNHSHHSHDPNNLSLGKKSDMINYIEPGIAHTNGHSNDDDDIDTTETDGYGICFKCNQRVLDETSGCTAMDQIYHISCFTCFQCQINLQGKPFYGIEGKPYCEYDYLQTLEKCSVCMKPILERILRATGKPYHPQCFTCVVCGNSLDGIPFTVDATNQNYCIEDFHKKFAPRCCVCKEPIMPEPGEEETVRVVALDRSFHLQCYKCEDCGLLLSSEAEGRGCYPLDDHVLCKSCNARRVQLLTNRMTTEL